MTHPERKIYKKAMSDIVFCERVRRSGIIVPFYFTEDDDKIAFVNMYKGWLLHCPEPKGN